jgi:hypothetical protein
VRVGHSGESLRAWADSDLIGAAARPSRTLSFGLDAHGAGEAEHADRNQR